MNRKDFLRVCGILGVGLPIMGSGFKSHKSREDIGNVIIIGAGAAGITAAHLLNQAGIEVKVLEASSMYGGRMKRTTDFADFPIPTGAEWLHTKKSILDKVLNDPDRNIDIGTTPYDFETDYALINGEKVNLKEVGFSIDQKFINSTWYDFFDEYIVPDVLDKIDFDQNVNTINYSADRITISSGKGSFEVDKLIITAPVKILQNGNISFTPPLPDYKSKALAEIEFWGGCKGFIEFREKFYPTVTGYESDANSNGHKLFYDASYGQDSSKNIMGLFAVGPISKAYTDLDGNDLINHILNELDKTFEGQASKQYIKHIFQNWDDEPYIGGAYVHYFEKWKRIRDLGKPIGDKIYFAGDAYTDGTEWSSVHAAANSAIRVAQRILK